MSFKAFIAGCAGFELSTDERAFFREARPWGLILFQRNIDLAGPGAGADRHLPRPARRRRRRAGRPGRRPGAAPRRARIGRPIRPPRPSGKSGGRRRDEKLAALVGPADRRRPAAVGHRRRLPAGARRPHAAIAHKIIGDRAYADNPADVARLGRAAALGLMAGGVMPVMKHIPGHGRALADSHLELPVRQGVARRACRRISRLSGPMPTCPRP